MFLDGEKLTNKQEFVDVPPVSELVQVQKSAPFDTSNIQQQVKQSVEIVDERAVDLNESELAKEFSDNKRKEPKAANDIKPKNTTASVPENKAKTSVNNDLTDIEIKDSGWVVQLGSFKHQKNVKELLNTLNTAGYRAYSRPVMTSMGELTKVFVGPELDKEKLQLALPHLKEITNLKGKITPFEVSAG